VKAPPISEHVIEPAKKAVDAPLITLHKAHPSQMPYERAYQTRHCYDQRNDWQSLATKKVTQGTPHRLSKRATFKLSMPISRRSISAKKLACQKVK